MLLLLYSRRLRRGLLRGGRLLRRLARTALISAFVSAFLHGRRGRLRLRPLRGGRRRWPRLLCSGCLGCGLLRGRRLRRRAWTALLTMFLCGRCGGPLRLLRGCRRLRMRRLGCRRRLRVGRSRRPLLRRALRRLAALFGLLLGARGGLCNDDRAASALLGPRKRRKRRHRHQGGPGEETRQMLRADARDHSWMLLMNLRREFTRPIATILCSAKDTSATACVRRTAPSTENNSTSKLVPGVGEIL
jgi:hypothetical protein